MDVDISTHETHFWELIRCLVGSHDLRSEYLNCVIFCQSSTNNKETAKPTRRYLVRLLPTHGPRRVAFAPFTAETEPGNLFRYSVGKCLNISAEITQSETKIPKPSTDLNEKPCQRTQFALQCKAKRLKNLSNQIKSN